MDLHTIDITDNFFDLDKFDRVNNEAFPAEERIPTSKLVELAKFDYIDLKAVYGDNSFIGFFMTVIQKPCAYIFFLAIDHAQRSKGYGAGALKLIDELYSGYQIVLDLEELDHTAPNIEQRVSRKKFYLRNGYHESGYMLEYLGMAFEVLFKGHSFDKICFEALCKTLRPVIGMTIPAIDGKKEIKPLLYAKQTR